MDLYSLGCLAYELFDGQPPFKGPSEAFAGAPGRPSGVPDELAEILPKLLIADPHLRMADAQTVLAAIERAQPAEALRPDTGPKREYEPGDVIDGKFDVRQRLGGGGFSNVYRVYRALEDREYALKIFNAEAAYEKVKREIEMLREVDHPHVVKAIWADNTSSGQWYLVTEYLVGETLEAYALGHKRLSAKEAVDLTLQLLGALVAIHPNTHRIGELETRGKSEELAEEEFDELQRLRAQGIVHRDVKPQNLMLTPRGLVLIDFNIASHVGQPMQTLSGTPPYQCPDMLGGSIESWDVSPDLFATGVVLYELLCCEHPYEHATPRPDRLPRDPREFRPDLSPALAEFLMMACQPHKVDRFKSAAEMQQALEETHPLVITPVRAPATGLTPKLKELLEHAPPNVNPMVTELLSLSSQARRTNRGTRGMDDLARATYVETSLDTELAESVLSGKHRL